MPDRTTLPSSLRAAPVALALVLLGPAAPAQSPTWISQFGTPTVDSAWAAASDGAGGAIVGGYTLGTFGEPSLNNVDAWVARLDATGERLWIRQFGAGVATVLHGAGADGSGGAFLCGHTVGSLWGPNAGLTDAWLARYDAAGNQLWGVQLGTSANDYARAAASDGASGVYVAGDTSGDLGGPNAGLVDLWLARYDHAGNALWIRQFGSASNDYLNAAAPDGSGGVYLCGYTQGDLAGPSAGSFDIWVKRIDVGGTLLWTRQFGTPTQDRATALASDGAGGVYVAGITVGSLAGPHAGGVQFDAWIGRMDGAGTLLWSHQLGTSQDDHARSAAPDGSGGVYVAGNTFGDLAGSPQGSAWVARYDGAGTELWIGSVGSNPTTAPNAAATDGSGGLLVFGETVESLGAPSAGNYDAWGARFALCGTTEAYCSAKPTSTGCTPAIGWSGSPSLSGGPGSFGITLSATRPGQPHVVFYARNTARSAAPFQGGLLCLQGPFQRSPVVFTSSTGECTSGTSIDFGGILAGSGAILAGDVLRAQWYGRDTLGNPSLSDALEFTVCP